MQWTEVKVVSETNTGENALDLIANLFYDLGLRGVVIEDPHLQPDENWGADAVKPPQHHAVSGFFPQNSDLDTNIGRLQEKLKTIETLHGIRTHLVLRNINEKDWAESWKTFFKPIKVSRNITIKPSWEELTPHADEIIIDIDPGMAFGTGTHPTTIMCIQMLQKCIHPMDSVLDVGTGSGILLVAAARLGAQPLMGVDSDRLATRIAESNLVRNGVAPESFEIVQGHLVEEIDRHYDIVVANLLTDIIVDLLDHIPQVLTPEGLFICAGIYAGHQDRVLKKMQACRMRLLDQQEHEDWICLVSRGPEA